MAVLARARDFDQFLIEISPKWPPLGVKILFSLFSYLTKIHMVLFTPKVTFLSKMNILCRMELDIFKKNRHSEVFGTKNRIKNK